jgi:hypothetical protein
MKQNGCFKKGAGLGLAAAKWLCDKKIVMVGSDTWATEVVPHKTRASLVHLAARPPWHLQSRALTSKNSRDAFTSLPSSLPR